MKVSNLGQFGKAGFAFALAFLGSLVTVLVGGASFGDVTAGQWVSAALAGLIAAGGVYGIPYVAAKAGGSDA